jgi:hypothetical protein
VPFFLATIALQVAFVVHLIKAGRNQMWIMIIVFLPLVGCIA